MDEPRESKGVSAPNDQSAPPAAIKDDADAAIAWYLSEAFEEHLGRSFEEGVRKALDARDEFLRSRQSKSTNETHS